MMNNRRSNIPDLLEVIRKIYDQRIKECGPVANGVYWKNDVEQALRLEILLSTVLPCDLNGPITINDLGCGYGALYELVRFEPMMRGGKYFGYDISLDMIKMAHHKINDERVKLIAGPVASHVADYSFVSGTYNMFLGADRRMWEHYIRTSLTMLWKKTSKVLAFNLLDNSTPKQLSDLYYANKHEFIDFALTLSPEVNVIDDYQLAEFTITITRPDAL